MMTNIRSLLVFCLVFAQPGVLPSASAQTGEEVKQLGISTIKLSRGATQDTLKVLVQTTARCTFGDFEAIALDASRSRKARVIVSLEPVSDEDNSFAPVTEELDPQALLEKGLEIQFKLPQVEKPTLLGLYICKDSDETGFCRGKQTIGVNQVLAYHERERDYGKQPPVDKIYVFHYLILSKGEVRFAQHPLNSERQVHLAGYLASQFGDGLRQSATFETIVNRSALLGSEPLRAKDNALLVLLPKLNQKKCGW